MKILMIGAFVVLGARRLFSELASGGIELLFLRPASRIGENAGLIVAWFYLSNAVLYSRLETAGQAVSLNIIVSRLPALPGASSGDTFILLMLLLGFLAVMYREPEMHILLGTLIILMLVAILWGIVTSEASTVRLFTANILFTLVLALNGVIALADKHRRQPRAMALLLYREKLRRELE